MRNKIKELALRAKHTICNNRGDTNMQYMIITVIAFVAIAVVTAAVLISIDQNYAPGMSGKIHDILT